MFVAGLHCSTGLGCFHALLGVVAQPSCITAALMVMTISPVYNGYVPCIQSLRLNGNQVILYHPQQTCGHAGCC
jgi:hypothetical protein